MRHVFTLAAPAVVLAALALSSPANAQQQPFYRTVTVSGEGKIETTPDRALLPVTIESRERSLAKAKQLNNDLTDKLLKITQTYKIPQEKLKTSGLSIYPQYRWESKTNKQVFETYVVSRSVMITIDEMEISEKLIAGLTEAGIDKVGGIDFTIANPEKVEADARTLAMKDARAKAEALAAAAGAKLGKVLTITTSGTSYQPPHPMPRMMAMKAEAADASAPPPVLAGTNLVQQSVNVVYELE